MVQGASLEVGVKNPATNAARVEFLRSRGVQIPIGRHAVYISPEVNLDRIESGAVLRNANIYGEKTIIRSGADIGFSGLVTIKDSQIGKKVELRQGVIEEATILDGAVLQEGFKVRGGSLMEEQSDIAHTVGLKNSILLFAAVMGSQVNYCDVLVGGGKSRKVHTEIGSTTTHFNYTPRLDKVASWIGPWVELAVWYHSRPTFVGGQTQVVGPVHIDEGAVVAAGSAVRHSVPKNVLYFEPPLINRNDPKEPVMIPFDPECYGSVLPDIQLTALMIGGYYGLKAWYEHVRLLHDRGDTLQLSIYESAIGQIQANIKERLKRLEAIAGKLDVSIGKNEALGKKGYIDEQKHILASFPSWLGVAKSDYYGLDNQIQKVVQGVYQVLDQNPYTGNFVELVKKGLEPNPEIKGDGTAWLKSIREHYAFPGMPG